MLGEDAAAAEGFLARFDAVLDTAHELNRQDPTLAAFLGVVRSDMRRHPEIAAQLAQHAERRDRFFVRLVDDGVESGEIREENREFMIDLNRITCVTDGV